MGILTNTRQRAMIFQDGLLFEPEGEGSYSSIIHIKEGNIRVVYGMPGSNNNNPYEVWYPGAAYSVANQTWQDIMSYIINR